MDNEKFYFYKKGCFNNNFDLVEIETDIEPSFIDKYNYKFIELLNIKKISILASNDKVKRIYFEYGYHPKININTGLFKTNKFKNKKINNNMFKDIKYDIIYNNKKSFNKNFINRINSIKKYVIEGDYIVYFFNKKIFDLEFDMYEVRKRITPKFLINENNNFLNIVDISENFIIDKIQIFTHQDKIQFIYLDSLHPNARTTDRCYCIPPFLIQKNIFQVKLSFIEELLKTYFLRNPYFYPWRYIKCQTY